MGKNRLAAFSDGVIAIRSRPAGRASGIIGDGGGENAMRRIRSMPHERLFVLK
jgi:hypothetical protein